MKTYSHSASAIWSGELEDSESLSLSTELRRLGVFLPPDSPEEVCQDPASPQLACKEHCLVFLDNSTVKPAADRSNTASLSDFPVSSIDAGPPNSLEFSSIFTDLSSDSSELPNRTKSILAGEHMHRKLTVSTQDPWEVDLAGDGCVGNEVCMSQKLHCSHCSQFVYSIPHFSAPRPSLFQWLLAVLQWTDCYAPQCIEATERPAITHICRKCKAELRNG